MLGFYQSRMSHLALLRLLSLYVRIFSMAFKPRLLLAAVDIALLALITWIGLMFHEPDSFGFSRLMATWLPFSAAWLLLAIPLGVFDGSRVLQLNQFWRPFWAMVLAAPFAGFLRALWLDSTVATIFVIFMGGLCALVLMIWRIYFVYLNRWMKLL